MIPIAFQGAVKIFPPSHNLGIISVAANEAVKRKIKWQSEITPLNLIP